MRRWTDCGPWPPVAEPPSSPATGRRRTANPGPPAICRRRSWSVRPTRRSAGTWPSCTADAHLVNITSRSVQRVCDRRLLLVHGRGRSRRLHDVPPGYVGSAVLVMHRVTLDPPWRGHGLVAVLTREVLILLATGCRAVACSPRMTDLGSHRLTARVEWRGVRGTDLARAWRRGASSHLGLRRTAGAVTHFRVNAFEVSGWRAVAVSVLGPTDTRGHVLQRRQHSAFGT